MVKYQRHIAVAVATLAIVDIIIGWFACAYENFDRAYLVPTIAASIALLIGGAGAFFRKPWVFGGGMLGVFYFCPSPLVFLPLLLGVVLLTMYAVATHRKMQGETHD